MSDRLEGGYIGAQPQWGANASSGIWTLSQQSRRRLSNVWPTVGDAYYDNVTLLLHMEGTSGSRVFTDSSKYNVAMSSPTFTTQNAVLSSTQAKFGSTSAYFDGNGDYIETPYQSSSRFSLLANNFTIELWFYATANTYGHLAGVWSSSGSYQSWFINTQPATGYIAFIADYTGVNDGILVQTSNAYSLNQWVALAVTRQGGEWRIFVNGVQKALAVTASSVSIANPGFSNLRMTFGSSYASGTTEINSFAGFIDEARLTNGVCRYTSDYTVSPIAFPNSK